MTVTVISASSVHAQPLADIYNYYIANTRITFEMDPVTSVEMAKRIADVQSIGLPWLVALEGDQVVGYAYATQWRARKAYQSSVESTVYLADGHRDLLESQRLMQPGACVVRLSDAANDRM